ncbi:hypothetical protein ACHAXR_010273 [Thalassiosira sp. AJA248-18]
MSQDIDGNAPAAAFGLVVAAAASTGLGASLVFFPKLIKLANHLTLAFALAMSSGVMIYISLVDIYTKAMTGFADSGHEEEKCFVYTTLSFFGGMGIMMLLNRIVVNRLLLGKDKHSSHEACNIACPSDYENFQRMTDIIQKNQGTDGQVENESGEEDTEESQDNEALSTTKEHADNVLFNMGVKTAIAIAIHNLPEGLVTFVAYLTDPTLGIVLAIGIALHNIPEGVCVAIPVYYATGNRWKAFCWGILSGVSEPIGALIGWAVLGQSGFSGNVYGILFGIVAGMMVVITIDELLPRAIAYDPKNIFTTYAFILGMFIIAASLMLFSI